jgi:hypothetical protein
MMSGEAIGKTLRRRRMKKAAGRKRKKENLKEGMI